MSIVDDFSHATWTYLLQCKSQALNKIKMFCNDANTHVQRSVKIIRSDNALEFDSTPYIGSAQEVLCIKHPMWIDHNKMVELRENT